MQNQSLKNAVLPFPVMVALLFMNSTLFSFVVFAQVEKTQNVFVICTDGFRWQEVFKGADSALINNPRYVQDTAVLKEQYWAATEEKRRELLMPFFWRVIAKKGSLFGNQEYDNKVAVKNLYKISYPGYSEMLSGHTDALLIPDLPINNRNDNVLEYLNGQPDLNGKVAAFTSWNVFPYIFNKKRTSFVVNSGYQKLEGEVSDSAVMTNAVQEGVKHKEHTRYDLLTFMNAKQYVTAHHPKVLFLSFGETDEFAHANRYDLYLQQANNIDKMIADLWYAVQTDPFYKGNTTFIITTDHGRGKYASTWHDHNGLVNGSGDIWLALLGANVPLEGEVKSKGEIYQRQIASTIASFLGKTYASKNIAEPFVLPGSQNLFAGRSTVPVDADVLKQGTQ